MPRAHTPDPNRYRPPDHYSAAFTKRDIERHHEVLAWLQEQHNAGRLPNVGALGRAVGVGQKTLRELVAGTYRAKPGRLLAALLEMMEESRTERHERDDLPLVRTSVYRVVEHTCDWARRGRDIGIVAGKVGVGKTFCARQYARARQDTFLIEGDPGMRPVTFFLDLVELIHATVRKSTREARGTVNEMLRACIRRLEGTDSLLILDEADRCSDATLEYARRLSDRARIGLVLIGNDALHTITRDPDGKHGQISSRTGKQLRPIQAITEADAARIVAAGLPDHGAQLDDAVQDAFWQMCDGKARLLGKLIRNVAELGIGQGHELTAELVYETGQQLMGLPRPAPARQRAGQAA